MALVKQAEAGSTSAQVEVRLNKNIRLPRDRYTTRVQKRDFGPSKSSGNPMVTYVWEIAAPNDFILDGKKVVIAGYTFTQYLVTRVLADGEKLSAAESTEKKHMEFAEFMKKMGGPLLAPLLGGAEWDDENPPLLDVGTLADVICNTKETPELKADKTPIKNSDGSDMKKMEHFIESFCGKSNVTLNRPF